MERIASFCIDHLKLNRGIYVSRKDHVGNETLTSFDIRMKLPYREPVLGSAEIHTIEHLAATSGVERQDYLLGTYGLYDGQLPDYCRRL